MLLTSILQGCASPSHETGRPILDEKVSKIVDGQTTLAEVVAMFGAPTQQTPMGKHVLYIYRHTIVDSSAWAVPYYGSGTSKENSDELSVTFDSDTEKVSAHSIQRGIAK
jgi:outer membrane protein assembly factor BamE (lipoprotein component of BamABCDE complex)